jgi:glucosylceramidase
MKTGNDTSQRRGLIGGTLDERYVELYGDYLARIVTGYAAQGLHFDTLTLQNEPGFAPSDYAGMLLSPAQEARLATATRAELDAAGATGTRLLGHDHNWDDADRASSLLDEPGAADGLDGVAFHCYGGDPDAQSTVHDAHPDADVYLTECTGTLSSGTFASNLLWNAEVLLIDGTRNWARSVLLWNLALDEHSGPRVGGCADCRGVVTVDSTTGTVTKNEEYYALGQLARGIDPGARRVASTGSTGSVRHVAFENPDGTHTVLVTNAAATAEQVAVRDGDRVFTYALPARSVATLRWEPPA